VVAAVGIVFVRHDGEIRMAGTVPLLRHLCNTLTARSSTAALATSADFPVCSI